MLDFVYIRLVARLLVLFGARWAVTLENPSECVPEARVLSLHRALQTSIVYSNRTSERACPT